MLNESGTWIMYGVSWDDPEEDKKCQIRIQANLYL